MILKPGRYFFDFTSVNQAENLNNFIQLQQWVKATNNRITNTRDDGLQVAALVEVSKSSELPEEILVFSPPTKLKKGVTLNDYLSSPEDPDLIDRIDESEQEVIDSVTETIVEAPKNIKSFFKTAGIFAGALGVIYLILRDKK
jgi:hypothetical protein